MSEEVQNVPQEDSLVKALGIAGLVIGIIALIVSFIPCFGIFAFWIGILGGILSGIAIFLANQKKVSKGLAIAAAIVSGIAIIIAFTQYQALSSVGEELQENAEKYQKQLEEAAEE